MHTERTAQPPRSLEEAIDCVLSLITDADRHDYQSLPDAELIAKLHFTLGYQIRGELELWGGMDIPFLEELSDASDWLIWDADSASTALMLLVRQRITLNSTGAPSSARQ